MSTATAVLSIHASTTSGEGVLADAQACRDIQVRPMCVTSTILSAGSGKVDALEPVSLALVAQQIESVLSGGRAGAARIGILAGARQVDLVGDLLQEFSVPSVVLAPVYRVAGTPITTKETDEAIRRILYPQARVLVVRAGELDLVTGARPESLDEMQASAQQLREQGAGAVLVSGGLINGRVLDLLDDHGDITTFGTTRFKAPRVEGLADAHAAALACHLARGLELRQAVRAAQRYIGIRLLRGR
jgi:hydroxymethylpyrimidine/phosphomethylpyrimidine kinase